LCLPYHIQFQVCLPYHIQIKLPDVQNMDSRSWGNVGFLLGRKERWFEETLPSL
jgi:hypothetical protein